MLHPPILLLAMLASDRRELPPATIAAGPTASYFDQDPVEVEVDPAVADPPQHGYLTFSAGPSLGFGDPDIFEVGAEWRFPELWHLAPVLGATWFEGGDTYCYAGVRWEIALGNDFYLAPGFAAGFYNHDSFSLGFPLEFRTSIEVGWQIEDSVRFGVTAAHLSNADLGNTNPGRDSLALTIAFRPAALFD
jgi:lipid A 3-O-deacylase